MIEAHKLHDRYRYLEWSGLFCAENKGDCYHLVGTPIYYHALRGEWYYKKEIYYLHYKGGLAEILENLPDDEVRNKIIFNLDVLNKL